MRKDVTLDIARLDPDWPKLDEMIHRAVEAALAQTDAPRAGELSVVLANDARVRELNRDYRGKDRATNVLSFPMEPHTGLLGDVVLSRETLQREAAEQGKAFADHVAHMLVHGVLHLHGFDHQDDPTATDMEAREVRALASLGIDNPYHVDNG